MAGRVVAYLLILLLINCKGGGKEKTVSGSKSIALKDIPVDFDGRPFTGWEITNFGPQGPVYVSGSEIILGMGEGCTGITWKGNFPTVNYEVSLEARRIEGNDFFCGMTFPVGKDPCTLIVGGWGGTTVGLSSIDGLDASDNSTRTLMQFEKNRWYHIRLAVSAEKLKHGSTASGWLILLLATGNYQSVLKLNFQNLLALHRGILQRHCET